LLLGNNTPYFRYSEHDLSSHSRYTVFSFFPYFRHNGRRSPLRSLINPIEKGKHSDYRGS